MNDTAPTIDATPQTPADKPKCIGCHSWRSISLLKTGCPSCMVVGLVLLPFSALSALARRLRGK